MKKIDKILSIKEYLDLGGVLTEGMKILRKAPPQKGVYENIYIPVTFIELCREGIRLKEFTTFGGTIWHYINVSITLSSVAEEEIKKNKGKCLDIT